MPPRGRGRGMQASNSGSNLHSYFKSPYEPSSVLGKRVAPEQTTEEAKLPAGRRPYEP